MNSIPTYLWATVLMTCQQLFILIGPGLLLAFLMHHLSRFVRNHAFNSMGRVIYIYFFASIGTAFHELGHAVFCVIFRHRITKIRLFDPDPNTGSLGYVNHSYDKTSHYQVIGNFFIGIGPILFGAAAIYVLTWVLLDPTLFEGLTPFRENVEKIGLWSHFWNLISTTLVSTAKLVLSFFQWKYLASWQLYIFIYLVFCIGSSITLSTADLQGAATGFVALITLLFLINAATMWALGDNITRFFRHLSQFCATFYAMMVFALILNIIAACVFLALPTLAGKKH